MAPAISTLRGVGLTYWPYLVKVMGFHHARVYNPKTQAMFEQDELGSLTPEAVKKFLCTMAYGTAEPGPDALPTNGRSSSVEFAKKAISYFMPNKNLGWNKCTREGNPIRSVLVNELIKK